MPRQGDIGAALAGAAGFGGGTSAAGVAAGTAHGIAHPAQDSLQGLALTSLAFHLYGIGTAGNDDFLNVTAVGATKFVNRHHTSP